jgi:hypothetical protein
LMARETINLGAEKTFLKSGDQITFSSSNFTPSQPMIPSMAPTLTSSTYSLLVAHPCLSTGRHQESIRRARKTGSIKIIYRRIVSGSPIKDTFVISASSLLGGLTKKQSIALLTALSSGYYDIPKRVSTEEISKGLGLPRTTFEEHLRKAESKALKAIMPLLQFSGSKVPMNGGNSSKPRLEQQAILER